jgi:hypothetical protein
VSGREPYPRELGARALGAIARQGQKSENPSAMEGCHAVLLADRGPDRPRLRAGVGTLLALQQVAGRVIGPVPSAPLLIAM